MATLTTLVDGTVPVAADFNNNFSALNTETRAVNRGGTGATTLTSNGVLLGNGTSAITATAAGSAYNVLRVPAAGGAPAFGAIDISQSAAVTGTLAVANGGLGIVTGTSGGVPYFSASTTIASSAELTANRLVLGGGAGAAPSALGSLGTTTTLLHGNAGGAPSFSAVVEGDLSLSDVTTANVSTTAHGFVPKAPNDTAQYLRGDGAWGTVSTTAAATQAEMEAATSTTVYASPGRTQYHPGVAKAWARWNDAGTLAASYNTTSITDSAVGRHVWNIATAFSSGNWAPALAGAQGGSDRAFISITAQAAGTLSIGGDSDDGGAGSAAKDLGNWCAAGFGDQA